MNPDTSASAGDASHGTGRSSRLAVPLLASVAVLILLLLVAFTGYALLRGPGRAASRYAGNPAWNGPTAPIPADVLTLAGSGDLRFGQTVAELTAAGAIRAEPSACGGQIVTGSAALSPVFVDDRLVLLWAELPVHTPEGISVGSPTASVRQAYPQLAELQPSRPGTFPGLLAADDDRAYLFLSDSGQVRKLVAGYTSTAQRLYAGTLNPC